MRRQINEYELDYMYRKIGAAIWHLQYVEDALATMIFIKGVAKEPEALTENEAEVELSKLRKLTLGQLLGTARTLGIIENIFSEQLKEFNNARKWIIHNSCRESGEDLYTDKGREEFLEKCEYFIMDALTLHKLIENDITEYAVSKGSSRSTIYSDAEMKIRKLKGEA